MEARYLAAPCAQLHRQKSLPMLALAPVSSLMLNTIHRNICHFNSNAWYKEISLFGVKAFMAQEISIFTKIVRGELPSYKLYEDDATLAFLDIFPVSKGHCLVICKEQYQYLEDVPDDLLASLMKSVKKVGAAVKKAFDCQDYNLIVNNGPLAGQLVPHLHFHIVPRRPGDGMKLAWKQSKLEEADALKIVELVKSAL
jgi:histidine triad (HIT) family protein